MIFLQPIYLEFNPGASTLTLIVIAFSLVVGILLSGIYYCFNYAFSPLQSVLGTIEDASINTEFVSIPTVADFALSSISVSQSFECKRNHVRVSAQYGDETIVYDDNVSYDIFQRALNKLPLRIFFKIGMFDQKIKAVELG